MRKLLVLAPLVLILAGCAAPEPADPLVTCIDVNVEYGLAADREEARDVCLFLRDDHPALLEPSTFDETFGSLDAAREWAKAEAAKER
jgi:hypothetical protein